MQRGEAVDVPGVDVRPLLQQTHDLLLVAGRARRQEHDVGGELDLARDLARLRGLAIRLGLLPALELFGSLEQGRARTCLERHCPDDGGGGGGGGKDGPTATRKTHDALARARLSSLKGARRRSGRLLL